MARMRVLFLCTGNSARSQMAEGLLRKLSRGRADVFSAGTEPRGEVHPVALETLRSRFDVDTLPLHPKHLDRFVGGEAFDYVITVCDRAAEVCPTFPGDPERIHWGFEDPAAAEGDDAQRRAFESVANGIAARLRIWMALRSVQRRLDEAAERE
jgi:arsenate reductase